jgi:uncharacterized membrane protein (UPF0127 family)
VLERLRSPVVALVLVVVLVAGGLLAYDEVSAWGEPDRATVTVVDGNRSAGTGTPDGSNDSVTVLDRNGSSLGTVEVRVADTYRERYTGLSKTDSLGPNEGMLFVHDEEGEYAYVMRDMAFPIDIVFVDANGTITAIHHAQTEERPYTRYRGTGKYVLEVPYEWTTEHGVEVGDRVRIDWANGTPPSGAASPSS